MVEGKTLLPHRDSVMSSTSRTDTRQVHLNESRFYAALPAAIPPDDGRLKGDPLELRHLEGDIPRNGGEVAVVVAAVVALTLLVTLIPTSLPQPPKAR